MNFMRLKHWLLYCIYVFLILRNYNLWVKSGSHIHPECSGASTTVHCHSKD